MTMGNHYYNKSRTFYDLPPKETLCLLAGTPSLPSPFPGNCWSALCLYGFACSGHFYRWNHILCDLLCLASFIQHYVFKVHPYCGLCQCFIPFYGPNNIPWCGCVDVYPPINLLMGIWDICTWWLLWIALLWTCTHTSFYVNIHFQYSWEISRNEIWVTW